MEVVIDEKMEVLIDLDIRRGTGAQQDRVLTGIWGKKVK